MLRAIDDRVAEAILYFIPRFKFIISDVAGTKISLNWIPFSPLSTKTTACIRLPSLSLYPSYTIEQFCFAFPANLEPVVSSTRRREG